MLMIYPPKHIFAFHRVLTIDTWEICGRDQVKQQDEESEIAAHVFVAFFFLSLVSSCNGNRNQFSGRMETHKKAKNLC